MIQHSSVHPLLVVHNNQKRRRTWKKNLFHVVQLSKVKVGGLYVLCVFPFSAIQEVLSKLSFSLFLTGSVRDNKKEAAVVLYVCVATSAAAHQLFSRRQGKIYVEFNVIYYYYFTRLLLLLSLLLLLCHVLIQCLYVMLFTKNSCFSSF